MSKLMKAKGFVSGITESVKEHQIEKDAKRKRVKAAKERKTKQDVSEGSKKGKAFAERSKTVRVAGAIGAGVVSGAKKISALADQFDIDPLDAPKANGRKKRGRKATKPRRKTTEPKKKRKPDNPMDDWGFGF